MLKISEILLIQTISRQDYCFVFFFKFNLILINNVELRAEFFFDVSASTGDLSDNRDMYSFKFYDLDSNATVITFL